MNKKELIPQLTALVEGYTEGLRNANNKLFHSGQRLTAEKQGWEQKYHSAMAANKRLDEQNEGLMVEKQALLDVISEWKNDNLSLNALNVTLSEKLQKLEELRASQYQDLLKQEQSSQNWQGNYYAMQQSKNSLAKELDVVKAKYEEACKVGNQWFEDFKNLTVRCGKLKTELEASKEQHEEFKKRSDGILATMGENLQKKQETIEALTTWKTGAESVLDTLEAKLKDAKDVIHTQEGTIELLVTQKQELSENLHTLKQINSFQEHRIEVLARKVNKMRKKEQND